MDRVDTLLTELSARHRNHDPRFLTAVRPLVASILDDGTPADKRVPLLELLAETFERDVQVRRDCEEARVALQQFLTLLRQLLLGERPR